MQTKKFKNEELKELRLSSIAKKYGCSTDYARKVLKGDSEQKSVLARKILKDANDIFQILNRETIITV